MYYFFIEMQTSVMTGQLLRHALTVCVSAAGQVSCGCREPKADGLGSNHRRQQTRVELNRFAVELEALGYDPRNLDTWYL